MYFVYVNKKCFIRSYTDFVFTCVLIQVFNRYIYIYIFNSVWKISELSFLDIILKFERNRMNIFLCIIITGYIFCVIHGLVLTREINFKFHSNIFFFHELQFNFPRACEYCVLEAEYNIISHHNIISWLDAYIFCVIKTDKRNRTGVTPSRRCRRFPVSFFFFFLLDAVITSYETIFFSMLFAEIIFHRSLRPFAWCTMI